MAGRQSNLSELVEAKTETWYNLYIVLLFIEGDYYEQENKLIRKSSPTIAVFHWTMAVITIA